MLLPSSCIARALHSAEDVTPTTDGCTRYAVLGDVGRLAGESVMVLHERCARARLRRVLARTSPTAACLANIAPSLSGRSPRTRSLCFSFIPLTLALESGSKASNWYIILTTRTTSRRFLNDFPHESRQVRPSALMSVYNRVDLTLSHYCSCVKVTRRSLLYDLKGRDALSPVLVQQRALPNR